MHLYIKQPVAGVAIAAMSLLAAPAHAAVDPYFTYFQVPSFFGQPGSTHQEWNAFTTATGNNAPVTVTNSAGGAVAFDSTAAIDGAFLAGTHIYSFSAATSPAVTVPLVAPGSGWITSVIFQIETLGSEIDLSSVKLTPAGGAPLSPALVTLLHQEISFTSFGASANDDYAFHWDVPGSAAAFTINLSASGPSMSWSGARVDTAPALITPEPASLGVLGVFSAFLFHRRKRS